MNYQAHSQCTGGAPRVLAVIAAAMLACTSAFGADAQPPAKAASAAAPAPKATPMIAPQNATFTAPTEVAPSLRLTVGRSALIRLQSDAARLSIGNPDVADVMLINPREVYVLGKKYGSTNVFVWTKGGNTTIMDVVVGVDTGSLKARLNELIPTEKSIVVESLGDSVVLSGKVADPLKVQRLVSLAEVYGGGKKVVNLLTVDGSQQVMLEVKVAEVSRKLLDKLGAQFSLNGANGGGTYSFIAQLLTGSAAVLSGTTANGKTSISIDAEIQNGLVKILAEPTIMAMSGQEGAFLAGGKIYIPVPQGGSLGAVTVTLEEKEFGVGLRFVPTLLEEGRINLRVTPEVSELSPVGTSISSVRGEVNVLPTILTRRASTTVQLRDGESFAIGGLIKSNVVESVKAVPVLGELPVLGALFRSTEFLSDRSELLFIVTPRMVKPLPPNYTLPTDNFIEPGRGELMLNGRMEGTPPPKPAPQPVPQSATQPAPQAGTQAGTQAGGFQLK